MPSVRQIRRPPRRSEVVVIGGGQLAPIGAVSVRLPSEALVRVGGVTFFAIDVLPDDGSAPWRLMRRYSHFHSLASSPEGACAGVPLPRKHLRNCAGERLEARRRGLELWLNQVVAQTQTPGPYLSRFLLVGRFAAPTPTQLPALPEPSAPPASAGSDGLVLLLVDVPPGVAAEGLLKVMVPDGQEVTIAVPWGVTPGSPLQLWFDPAAGTLGVHQEQDWQALHEA